MGGCSMVDDDQSPLTLVLIGKTGNGKSATGNSILGTKNFESKRSSSGVTMTSELHTTKLETGQTLNVIDTPGMFDLSADANFIRKEILSCIDMAKDGIHAVLAVFSIFGRFLEDDLAALRSLDTLFGDKIYDHVIFVFTGGDELEKEGKSLEEFLDDSPDELKKVLLLCGNRRVLFDNRTKDTIKKAKQVDELLSLVNMVLEKNGGEPYTNEIFTQLKIKDKELKEQKEKFQALNERNQFSNQALVMLIEKMHDKQLERISEMVKDQLNERIQRLEKSLKEEQDARKKAEENAKEEKNKFQGEIKKLEEEIAKKGRCVIM